MKDSKDFSKEEWKETSRIAKILQEVREVNEMLNSFVLFLLTKNFFKLTPQYGIDEYGIPIDADYGDDQTCFALMDGQNILFRYWPLVNDIKISLAQQGEKKLKTTFDFCLNFKDQECRI